MGRHKKPLISGKYDVGYGALAAAIVVMAISDIKECSPKEIKRFEDPEYLARGHVTQKCLNYKSAKGFMHSRRFAMFSDLEGAEVYQRILEEKAGRIKECE